MRKIRTMPRDVETEWAPAAAASTATHRPPPLLEARGLQKSYGQTTALDGACLAVAPGRVVAVVGASGSGKSTLLHCLAGLVPPDHGEVLFDGVRLDDKPDSVRSGLRRTSFGFVFQSGDLVPELSALDNVALPLRLVGIRRRPAQEAAVLMLERFGVASVRLRRPAEISGGQAQRVAVARALINRPRVVFADEPTGALDSANRGVVLRELLACARSGDAAVVLVTHDLEVAAAADATALMSDGRVVRTDTQR